MCENVSFRDGTVLVVTLILYRKRGRGQPGRKAPLFFFAAAVFPRTRRIGGETSAASSSRDGSGAVAAELPLPPSTPRSWATFSCSHGGFGVSVENQRNNQQPTTNNQQQQQQQQQRVGLGCLNTFSQGIWSTRAFCSPKQNGGKC